MKQQDKRAIWLALAGVGMAAVAFFMYTAGERLSKSGIEKAARDYDANGQIGEPPPGWKDDYSHWDSENWGMPVEELGLLYPDGELDYSYSPVKLSEEGQRRLEEIVEETRQTRGKETAKAIFSKEQKTGNVIMLDGSVMEEAPYSNAHLQNGEIVYVGVSVYDLHGFVKFGNIARLFSSPNNFSIGYYRRSPDGALMREVISPSSGLKHIAAAPAPDMSTYTEAQIKAVKHGWIRAIASIYGCYD